MKPYSVALFNKGEEDVNTIVLPGTEIIIPLEEDVDCDPFQDDEIRLMDLCGEGYERIVKSSDPEAVPNHDERLIYYHFTDVPAGLYRLSVRIGGHWVDLASDLIVTPKGAFLGKDKLGKSAPQVQFDSRPVPEEPVLPKGRPASPRLLPKHMDQNPNRWDWGSR
ncbi:MAG: hypothetical protein HYX27_16775 [Acidobacteria bacterium]|nr:hypothetical protein [Acidobacteriota bacterium]